MCGINAYVNFSGVQSAEAVVRKMNDQLAHRGPDDEGCVKFEEAVLGHRRLSIIDLSKAGKQPFSSSNGRYHIIYNGEVYNFVELKNELKGYPFVSQTDTEVVLAAFIKWGKACVDRFNGMFAFAIWDDIAKELFVARDRLGIKPLYYFLNDDNSLLISSELRPLLKTGMVPRKICENGLFDYVKYQTVHAPFTIVKNVRMLEPGHLFTFNKGGLTKGKYWDKSDHIGQDIQEEDYASVCKNINGLLLDAVERRLVADVPSGAFLSGGIDSSIVVGLMSKLMSKHPQTFSVGFVENEYNELDFARTVAKRFNVDHHPILLKQSELVNDLPDVLAAMDHPSGDGPNTYVVSKATKKQGITMALSGLGGDELFAGYKHFNALFRIQESRLNLIPLPLRKIIFSILKNTGGGSINRNKKLEVITQNKLNIDSCYFLIRRMLLDDDVARLLKTNNNKPELPKILFDQFEGLDLKDKSLSKISVAELDTYLANVLLRDTDQMSMAHSLEIRVPFLDHSLVEYVLKVKDDFKYPVTPKKLLVDSMDGLITDEITNRPKMGFTFPWDEWLKRDLRNLCEERFESLGERAFFDKSELNGMLARFMNGDNSINWSRIWYLVVLEDYLQRNGIETT